MKPGFVALKAAATLSPYPWAVYRSKVGSEAREVAALTLMTERDDIATVDPRAAARKRADRARLIFLVVKFMATSNPTDGRHDFEVNEFNAMVSRRAEEKFMHRDCYVTRQCQTLT